MEIAYNSGNTLPTGKFESEDAGVLKYVNTLFHLVQDVSNMRHCGSLAFNTNGAGF